MNEGNRYEILNDLLEYSKKLSTQKLVIGPGGNTSCRIGDYIYIKPSGLSFAEMEVNDFVKVNLKNGEIAPDQKQLKPSSEILMHRYLYLKRQEISCIFHAHPPITIGIAAAGVRFGHIYPDDVAYLGKEILELDYIIPTTNVLAEYIRDRIESHLSIVLKNHGAITLGNNPKTTYLRMELLENLAYCLWIAAGIAGKQNIRYLSKKEIEDIINLDAEKYRTKLYEPNS